MTKQLVQVIFLGSWVFWGYLSWFWGNWVDLSVLGSLGMFLDFLGVIWGHSGVFLDDLGT